MPWTGYSPANFVRGILHTVLRTKSMMCAESECATMSTLTTEQKLASAGLRIICICLLSDEYHNCVYKVFTSDGGIVQYIGYNAVPDWVKEWMSNRNAWNYVIPSCMLISACEVV